MHHRPFGLNDLLVRTGGVLRRGTLRSRPARRAPAREDIDGRRRE